MTENLVKVKPGAETQAPGVPPSRSNTDSRGGSYDRSQHRPRGGRERRGGRARGRGSGRGGGNGRDNDRRGHGNRGEQGRGEWSRNPVDKRQRNEDGQANKRQKLESGTAESKFEVPFSKEEIAEEERKPKRKVAVLLGYAGSGYKGMQISPTESTIEGELFKAFVKAGAISKANADDPKKSSLVRCARTDKGVHAAGNVISLKLIVEDPDIVSKINENLPDQIRIWGMERTNGAFSCYQSCDSRWYEYLIPTYSFLPPHPQSFLGKKLVQSAQNEGLMETYESRQEDVATFWEDGERDYIQPILSKLDPDLQVAVMEAVFKPEEEVEASDELKQAVDELPMLASNGTGGLAIQISTANTIDDCLMGKADEEVTSDASTEGTPNAKLPASETAERMATTAVKSESKNDSSLYENSNATLDPLEDSRGKSVAVLSPLDIAVKDVKAAYIAAKKAYRISISRRERVQAALNSYAGTRNFHNYTVHKTFRDPSAKRVIRSFKVGAKPIIINDTEWLSLKVHGQSFMMHQIRKMVAMVALVVRCGCELERITQSYGEDNISIPKAPGLGLLLERPVFETYNERAVRELEKEKIDFGKFEKEIEEFKQKQIYERIFREEEKDHQFHTFFHHIDHFRTDYFLWVTATGIPAAKQSLQRNEAMTKAIKAAEVDSDEEDPNGEEG